MGESGSGKSLTALALMRLLQPRGLLAASLRALIAAVPDPSRKRQPPPGGDLPNPTDVPSGRRFHPRYPLATDVCRRDDPALRPIADAHAFACHHA